MLFTPIIIFESLGMLHRYVSRQEKTMAGYGTANRTNSNSRAILHKAVAYSLAYLLAWGWAIVSLILTVAGVEISSVMWYFMAIFMPLQGFYNLLIFVHPRVVKIKTSGGSSLSSHRAFVRVLWFGLIGTGIKPSAKQKRTKQKASPPKAKYDNEESSANIKEEDKSKIRAPLTSDDFVENASPWALQNDSSSSQIAGLVK
jgi:hypothetical protein